MVVLPNGKKARYGELTRLKRFFTKKSIVVTVLNAPDPRMERLFLSKKMNYRVDMCNYEFIKKYFVEDKEIIKKLGIHLRMSLTLDELLEVKAHLMVRNAVWRKFQIFNDEQYGYDLIKYNDDTEFLIEFISF